MTYLIVLIVLPAVAFFLWMHQYAACENIIDSENAATPMRHECDRCGRLATKSDVYQFHYGKLRQVSDQREYSGIGSTMHTWREHICFVGVENVRICSVCLSKRRQHHLFLVGFCLLLLSLIVYGAIYICINAKDADGYIPAIALVIILGPLPTIVAFNSWDEYRRPERDLGDWLAVKTRWDEMVARGYDRLYTRAAYNQLSSR